VKDDHLFDKQAQKK